MIDEELWQSINYDDVENITKIYEKSCPIIHNSGIYLDSQLFRVIALGEKLQFNYLQNLVDMYNCCRVKCHKHYGH